MTRASAHSLVTAQSEGGVIIPRVLGDVGCVFGLCLALSKSGHHYAPGMNGAGGVIPAGAVYPGEILVSPRCLVPPVFLERQDWSDVLGSTG